MSIEKEKKYETKWFFKKKSSLNQKFLNKTITVFNSEACSHYCEIDRDFNCKAFSFKYPACKLFSENAYQGYTSSATLSYWEKYTYDSTEEYKLLYGTKKLNVSLSGPSSGRAGADISKIFMDNRQFHYSGHLDNQGHYRGGGSTVVTVSHVLYKITLKNSK